MVPPPVPGMERAARLINKSKLSRSVLSDDDLARAVWPAAVGKTIASHTVRVKIVRTTLVVEMEDAMWQKQLYPLASQILHRLRTVTGSSDIQDIEFRAAVARRQPQRAESREGGAVQPVHTDEADHIQDPVLKRVYRMSRKRASA